ncbi:MAG: hypothetical protein A4E73_01402 [Syntrophaceae bacterium PtaU1.Bin231]|nr:MAG: hypothetical protein A4E73_01402 [Syntrophaceae bacterium PtaU1.Bin231]
MKTRFAGFLFVVFATLLFAALSAAPSFAFRCGDGLVGVGDSKAKVLLECGPPTLKETTAYRSKRSHPTGPGTRTETIKSVEQWYYNCGDNDFIYVLTFEGGTMIEEDTSGRGKGKSDCLGRQN